MTKPTVAHKSLIYSFKALLTASACCLCVLALFPWPRWSSSLTLWTLWRGWGWTGQSSPASRPWSSSIPTCPGWAKASSCRLRCCRTRPGSCCRSIATQSRFFKILQFFYPSNFYPNQISFKTSKFSNYLAIYRATSKFNRVLVSRQRHQTSSKVRLTRLLLTLLPVSAVDKTSLETLFFQRTLGAVAVDKLVMDLLQVIFLQLISRLLYMDYILIRVEIWRRD